MDLGSDLICFGFGVLGLCCCPLTSPNAGCLVSGATPAYRMDFIALSDCKYNNSNHL